MITPLLTVAQMAEADRLTISRGIRGFELMKRAGQAVADQCSAELAGVPSSPVVVLCGPGNNGGDGFVAARILRDDGRAVSVHLAGDVSALSGDAALAAAEWDGPVANLSEASIEANCLVVDALFGAGLSRDIGGDARAVIERVNQSNCRVVAVDVPSGVHGDTGLIGGVAIEADLTVTFFRPKPGHYLLPGADLCGQLVVADIGIDAAVIAEIGPEAFLNLPALWLSHYPWPTRSGHKYTRGHAVVVSGGLSHTGAARLSARSALRVGAGLVTLASPSDALAVNAAHLTAVMVRAFDGVGDLAALLADSRKNAVVLGPGLGVGKATAALVTTALSGATEKTEGAERACVLDADALTSFENRSADLAMLIRAVRRPVVITPHDGEFARLFGADPDVTGRESKLDKARAAAEKLGCVVILKGADTVVADPGGRASVAAGDAPWLATAGSGDVLSGLVGGLLAQRMPAFEAASAAVWLHAAAARAFGPGLIAEDLPESLPRVLADLQAQITSKQQRNPASA